VEQGFRIGPPLSGALVAGLRIAAVGFVARALAGVLATTSTVRMHLARVALIDSGCATLQIVLVPIALWLFTGDVVVAVMVGAAMNVVAALLHVRSALALQPGLRVPAIRASLMRPLLAFSISTSLMAVSGLVLLNIEKIAIVRLASPAALAYYTVAFTVARLLAVLPISTARSLLPAFARLHPQNDRAAIETLANRALRGLFLWSVPTAVAIGSVAAPFLTVWAGPEYGRQSVWPLYVLMVGCAVDGLAYVPRTLLSASGRPDLVARVHALALAPYAAGVAALILLWGTVGAAMAWTLRAIIECVAMMVLARRTTGIAARVLPTASAWRAMTPVAVLLPLWVLTLVNQWATGALALGAVILAIHAFVSWTRLLTADERQWAERTLRDILRTGARRSASVFDKARGSRSRDAPR
jgi:O-antigen/teichoic acid export membrane protein